MPRRSIKTTNLLGAVPQLVQFITNHSATLTDKGVKPDDIKTKLADCVTTVQAAEQSQANAKTTLKVATQTHNDTVAQRYPGVQQRDRSAARCRWQQYGAGQAAHEYPQAGDPASQPFGQQCHRRECQREEGGVSRLRQ